MSSQDTDGLQTPDMCIAWIRDEKTRADVKAYRDCFDHVVRTGQSFDWDRLREYTQRDTAPRKLVETYHRIMVLERTDVHPFRIAEALRGQLAHLSIPHRATIGLWPVTHEFQVLSQVEYEQARQMDDLDGLERAYEELREACTVYLRATAAARQPRSVASTNDVVQTELGRPSEADRSAAVAAAAASAMDGDTTDEDDEPLVLHLSVSDSDDESKANAAVPPLSPILNFRGAARTAPYAPRKDMSAAPPVPRAPGPETAARRLVFPSAADEDVVDLTED
jgi:hypothetical protein